MRAHPVEVAKLIVYAQWFHHYLNPLQEDLHALAEKHFPTELCDSARLWTATLTGGVAKDVGLVSYLVMHGLVSEAGLSIRRSMENVGVLAHLWKDPSKAAFLADDATRSYRNAFESERNHARELQLKAQGIKKRFEACAMAQPLSMLYSIFSTYAVHGGSPVQLLRSELRPTAYSDMLVNRPDPMARDLSEDIDLLHKACEALILELVTLRGDYGKLHGMRPSPGGEGGFFFTHVMLDPVEMARVTAQALAQLQATER